jgi:hypothetical protein
MCAQCRGVFTLRAGRLIDPAVVPPPWDPHARNVKVTSAGIVLRKMGLVSPLGVSEGVLDPVTGLIPMEESGVAFGDIYTVAVWRKVDVIRLIVNIVLVFPFVALFVFLGMALHPVLLVVGLPFDALLAFGLHGALVNKVNFARIVGAYRAVTVRFDRPMWRRRRFHDELLRRAGISPTPIP